jgi:hypothetical protein
MATIAIQRYDGRGSVSAILLPLLILPGVCPLSRFLVEAVNQRFGSGSCVMSSSDHATDCRAGAKFESCP